MSFDIPIEGAPKWMSHVEFTDLGDGEVCLRLVKRSGEDYGYITLTAEKFDAIIKVLSA